MKNLLILGSTGSIGRQALALFDETAIRERYRLYGLVAYGKNVEDLLEQVARYQPKKVAVYSRSAALELKNLLTPEVEVLWSDEGVEALSTAPEVDVVLSGIAGTSALKPTFAAVKAGKTVALANKESLVSMGELMMKTARSSGAQILPVDSEHSAIFQVLQGRETPYVNRLLLTASGGPFLSLSLTQLKYVKPTDALSHPNWKMGPLVTVNSATLMNKGQEIIEAHHLFQIPYSQIDAVIHPQSIVHSMVEFVDKSVLAQMSVPDMRGAILYALSYPERIPSPLPSLNLTEVGTLTFFEIDPQRFPCYQIARKAAEKGGLYPAVMNAANEVAVSLFLQEQISFTDIPRVIEQTLIEFEKGETPRTFDIDSIFTTDHWARHKAVELCRAISPV